MAHYMISYDLRQPADTSRYQAVEQAIATLGTVRKLTESTRYLTSSDATRVVFDMIWAAMKARDRLAVVRISVVDGNVQGIIQNPIDP